MPVNFPFWMIGKELFSVTNLPFGFEANGFDLKFHFTGDVSIRCVFQIFLGGAFMQICSNTSEFLSDDKG